MTPAPWRERLRDADTELEVIEVANAYLANLGRTERALLPPRCRPRTLRCAYDVSSYAFDLVGHYCAEGDIAARVVHPLAAFFTDASIRISEIVSGTKLHEAPERRTA